MSGLWGVSENLTSCEFCFTTENYKHMYFIHWFYVIENQLFLAQYLKGILKWLQLHNRMRD